jgi:hypothetical protein
MRSPSARIVYLERCGIGVRTMCQRRQALDDGCGKSAFFDDTIEDELPRRQESVDQAGAELLRRWLLVTKRYRSLFRQRVLKDEIRDPDRATRWIGRNHFDQIARKAKIGHAEELAFATATNSARPRFALYKRTAACGAPHQFFRCPVHLISNGTPLCSPQIRGRTPFTKGSDFVLCS